MSSPAIPARPKTLLVVGSSVTDLTMTTPYLPLPGQTVFGRRAPNARGGKGANQATAAATTGVPVTFVSAVGDDEEGRAARTSLERDGIDIRWVSVHAEAATGLALIAVDDRGENSIIVDPGANSRLSADAISDAVAQTRPAVIAVSLEIPIDVARHALELGEQQGACTVLNLSPADAVSRALASLAQVVIVNETEAAALLELESIDGRSAEELSVLARDAGLRTVIITRGADGALAIDADGEVHSVPAVPVTVVDTTGCGDAFAGVFAAELARSTPLRRAVAVAVAAASFAAQRAGTQLSYATPTELREWISTTVTA